MTFDPTTNLIPFGLMTKEDQDALKAWQHGWECFASSCGWSNRDHPMWSAHLAYRGKPAPIVTSVWFNVYSDWVGEAYFHKLEAEQAADQECIGRLRIDTCNGVPTVHLEDE